MRLVELGGRIAEVETERATVIVHEAGVKLEFKAPFERAIAPHNEVGFNVAAEPYAVTWDVLAKADMSERAI